MHLPFKVGISPTLKIRGIIATENIKSGQIIEICPVILFPVSEEQFINQTLIKRYYFEWSKKQSSLTLGYASLYNHSYNPNANVRYDYKNRLIKFYAIKDIKPQEEITFNYNGRPLDQKMLEPHYFAFDK